MSHCTAPTYLVWTILSSLLGIFLVYHLWCFDRFKCLRWNQGSQGAFKRVMTYSYLLSVPLTIAYAMGFCIIKYTEGYMDFALYGVIPTPYELWTPAHKSAIVPLYLCLAIAWGLEMVTHLEELCFWLFVLNAGPTQKDWFGSLYFKTWIVGSVIAVLAMPMVTIFTRSDPLKCEAYTFLAGSIGSLALTLWFLPVLHLFRPFLGGLRKEGVDSNTIIRLTKFHELNTIRVVFRLLFAVPLFILAVDGVRPHHHINDTMFGTELLAIAAGFGVVVSSGITLVIFFPRSIENEILAHESGIRSRGLFSSRHQLTFVSQEQEIFGTYDLEDAQMDCKDIDGGCMDTSPPPFSMSPEPMHPSRALYPGTHSPSLQPGQPPQYVQEQELTESPTTEPVVRLVPNRRPPSPSAPPAFTQRVGGGGVEICGTSPLPPRPTTKRLQVDLGSRFNNPAIMQISKKKPSFRTPIDLRGRPSRR